jgi:chromosome segregation ATPase
MGNSIGKLLDGGRSILTRQSRAIPTDDVHVREHSPPADMSQPSLEATQTQGRLATVRSEFEKFSALLSREVATFSAVHAKLEADHAVVSRRLAETTRELREARDALDVAQSQNSALAAEQTRLRNEHAGALLKIDALSGDLHAAREQLSQHQMRCERLEADYGAAVDDANRKDMALIEARQDVNDLSQRCETARVQVEQARRRESELEARAAMLDVELKELTPRFDEVSRHAAAHREKIVGLESEVRTARVEIDARDRRIAELETERSKLAETCGQLSAKLAESRDASEVKVDALARTKSFLWSMSEKQRKQIADQITRISRLESDNSRLAQALLDADGKGEPKRTLPKVQPKGADGALLN